MREAAGLCSDCGGDHHAHYGNCPRIVAAFAQQRVPRYDGPVPGQMPQPTAYERDQQALREGIGNARYVAENLSHRLDAALQRIEQLELEVAKLKQRGLNDEKIGPGIWRPNMVTVTKVDIANGRIELTAERLPCGCKPPHCGGHQFSSSPATAYPPIPDEPTV